MDPELAAIVGDNGQRGHWRNPCKHIFGTVYGSPDEFDRFVEMCEGLHNTGDLVTVAIGAELAPTTGRPHLHITASHNGKKSFNWWRSKLRDAELYLPDDNMENPNPGDDADETFGVWFRVRRGTLEQARQYALKNGDVRMDVNDAVNQQGRRSDIEAFVSAVRSGAVTRMQDVLDQHPSILARHHRFVQLVLSMLVQPDPTRGRPLPVNLRTWQIDLLEIALRDPEGPADNRTINIVLGTAGNEGKSFMGRYLQRIIREYFNRPEFKVQVIRPNKADNMAYVLREDNDVIIFDVPRARSCYFQTHLAEEIKDGLVTSYKYEPRELLLKPCHVFIFTNHFTNEDENGSSIFSEDRLRWLVIGENDMRPRRFEEAVQRLAYADPEVPNHGPAFNGDNAGDGPVMNHACYKFMYEREPCRLIEGIPVHTAKVVREVTLETEKPNSTLVTYKLENWPKQAASCLRDKDGNQWCMKKGTYVALDPAGGNYAYYNSGPIDGRPSTWYTVVYTRNQLLRYEPVELYNLWVFSGQTPTLPPGIDPPYLIENRYTNKITYSLNHGWAKGCAPEVQGIDDDGLAEDRHDKLALFMQPYNYPGTYENWVENYLVPKWQPSIVAMREEAIRKEREKKNEKKRKATGPQRW